MRGVGPAHGLPRVCCDAIPAPISHTFWRVACGVSVSRDCRRPSSPHVCVACLLRLFFVCARARAALPDVPNQFVVLYGMKSLAIKNINEFLYGIRACRQRQKPDGTLEAEPIVYIFWKVRVHVRARSTYTRARTRAAYTHAHTPCALSRALRSAHAWNSDARNPWMLKVPCGFPGCGAVV